MFALLATPRPAILPSATTTPCLPTTMSLCLQRFGWRHRLHQMALLLLLVQQTGPTMWIHRRWGPGSDLTWTQQVGAWTVATGKANASALSGGKALATVPATLTPDLLIAAALTRSAGVVGLVVRYTDTSNYVVAYHDGTNAKLDQVVAGVTTNKISAAATYSASAILRCAGRRTKRPALV